MRCFDDAGETVILVSHGSYIRTVSYWEGDAIAFRSFRPAAEDILVYSPQWSLLCVKASLEKERTKYLQAFCACFLNDPGASDAPADDIFSLAPLQDGTFDFRGGGDGDVITRVDLVKVRMRLFGVGNPVFEVKSDDLMWTFDRDLGQLSLQSGQLVFARFRFHLRPEGETRPVKVTFEIEPPPVQTWLSSATPTLSRAI